MKQMHNVLPCINGKLYLKKPLMQNFALKGLWVAWQSQRQSLVALSSAEAELIASVWGNGYRLALSLYGLLSEMILEKPTYATYCHSVAVAQLSQQLAASKTRTRDPSMRAAWRHHLRFENVSMQCVPTNYSVLIS